MSGRTALGMISVGGMASPVAQMVGDLPASAGDLGLLSGSGRPPGEGKGDPLQILAWKIPWTEEPGGLPATGSKRVEHD